MAESGGELSVSGPYANCMHEVLKLKSTLITGETFISVMLTRTDVFCGLIVILTAFTYTHIYFCFPKSSESYFEQ